MDRARIAAPTANTCPLDSIDALRTTRELCRDLLTLLREAVPAAAVAIVLPRADGELHVIETITRQHGRVPISEPLAKRVLATGTAMVAHDTLMSPASGGGEGAMHGVRSLLCVPITRAHRVLGALYVAAAETAAFDDDHLQLATSFASVAAFAVESVSRLTAARSQQGDGALDHTLVGESLPMQRLYDRLGRVARAPTTVLLTGETGTGKELAAHAIHGNSTRARRPFIAINCAALTETLLESELFGHERGAFTGAVSQKRGRLELADGGTVFLDEIGELPPTMQAKLLRVLQQREFERVGGTQSIRVDIRVISATNRCLADDVRAGRFREDLYFRLNVVTVELPPLRDRRCDIPLLARHFMRACAAKTGRLVTGISPAALACLQAYRWPGNVRELENVIERAVVLGSAEEILPDDLAEPVRNAAAAPAVFDEDSLRGAMLETKKRAIVEAFGACGGSYVETARSLNIHPNYLHRLVRHLGLRATLKALSSSPLRLDSTPGRTFAANAGATTRS